MGVAVADSPMNFQTSTRKAGGKLIEIATAAKVKLRQKRAYFDPFQALKHVESIVRDSFGNRPSLLVRAGNKPRLITRMCVVIAALRYRRNFASAANRSATGRDCQLCANSPPPSASSRGPSISKAPSPSKNTPHPPSQSDS